jgi:hypothetical protein
VIEPEYALSWARGAGAEACPGARELAREVERRLRRRVFDAAAALSLEVQVSKLAKGLESRVFLRDEQGAVLGERTIAGDGAECESLFAATALAIALLIDPDAPLGPLPAEPVPGAAGAALPPTRVSASDQQPKKTGSNAESSPAPSARAREERAPRDPQGERGVDELAVARRARSTRSFGLAAQAAYAAGVVPGAGFGAALVVDGSPHARWGWLVRGLYLSPSDIESAPGAFRVGLTALALALSLEVASSPSVRFSLDAGPWIGAVHVAVLDPRPTDVGDFLFAAFSGGSRVRLRLAGSVFGEASASLVTPLVRRGLFVEGVAEPVWRQPPLAGLFGAGLGMQIP